MENEENHYLQTCLKNNNKIMPWLVWLSGLSDRLWTEKSPVQFPARTYAWVVCQVPSSGGAKGNCILMFPSLSSSLLLSLKKINNNNNNNNNFFRLKRNNTWVPETSRMKEKQAFSISWAHSCFSIPFLPSRHIPLFSFS